MDIYDICQKIRNRIHDKVRRRWIVSNKAHNMMEKDPKFWADINQEEEIFVDNLMEMMKQHGLS